MSLATDLSSPATALSSPASTVASSVDEELARQRDRGESLIRQQAPIWHRESEYECRGLVLSWEGLAGHKASWKPRLFTLWQGKLYVTTPPAFTSEGQAVGGGKRAIEDAATWVSSGNQSPSDGITPESLKAAEVRSFWRKDARVMELQPSFIGGAKNCLALAPDGLSPQSAPESPNALVIRMTDEGGLREMKMQLLKSRRAMQSLAGLLDPLGDLGGSECEDPSSAVKGGGTKTLTLGEEEEADVFEEMLKHKDWLEVVATVEELSLR